LRVLEDGPDIGSVRNRFPVDEGLVTEPVDGLHRVPKDADLSGTAQLDGEVVLVLPGVLMLI
jgi:hypothetical protein